MYRSFITFLIFFASAYAGTEDVLNSDLSTYPESDYQTYDRDTNVDGIKKWEIQSVSNDAVFRSRSMPDPAGFEFMNDKQDNLLLSPYVANSKKATWIKLTFRYNQVNICPTYSPSPGKTVQCKNGFKYAVLKSADASTNHSQINLDGGSAEIVYFKEITATSSGSDVTESVEVPLPDGTVGYRLGFWDQGSSFDIKGLRVQQLICSRKTFSYDWAICPETSTWINGSRPVQCTCDPSKFVRRKASATAIFQCERNNPPGFDTSTSVRPCECIPGYHPKSTTTTLSFACVKKATVTTTPGAGSTTPQNPPTKKPGSTAPQSPTTKKAGSPSAGGLTTSSMTTTNTASRKDLVAVGILGASIIGLKMATFITALVESLRKVR